MNENINLTKILDGCPVGTEFYNDTFGKLFFFCIKSAISQYRVEFKDCYGRCCQFTEKGTYYLDESSECSVSVFPSKEQRDWSKFERFWDKPKIERLNPKTLKPFDKVLVRDNINNPWICDHFSYINHADICITTVRYKYCIPYNDDTKHLIGTTKDAPEYYRYWEDK